MQKLVEVVVDMDTSQLTGVRPHAQLLGGEKGEGGGRRREVEGEEGKRRKREYKMFFTSCKTSLRVLRAVLTCECTERQNGWYAVPLPES